MKTFLMYLGAFLLLCLYIFSMQYIERGKKISLLEGEKSELTSQLKSKEAEIEKYNQKQVEASEQIQKVREVIKLVNEPCDCYNTPLPDDVKRLLHDNLK